MEQVDKLSIVHLWHQLVHRVGHGVVKPVQYNSWNNTVGAIVESSQEQAHCKGVGKLSHIAVHGTEKQGRSNDGNPRQTMVEVIH